MTPIDIILILVIALCVILAFRQTRKARKSGGCSCGCDTCGKCHR